MMAEAALRDHDGPVLLVAGDVPGLDGRLAAAAVDDLAAGVAAVWAPTSDGSPFLVALPAFDTALLELLDAGFEAWAGAAVARGGGLGMLRSERRLTGAADARALAADPLAPEDLLRHMRHALPVRRAT